MRSAAALAGLRSYAHEIVGCGPAGESLTIDVAWAGAERPKKAVILSSGLHGVEGYFGSALQLAWLTTSARNLKLADDAAVILIHAINPYGFAWARRCNECNVDLNRNFLRDWSAIDADPGYRESLAVYERLRRFLNPVTARARFEPVALKMVLAILDLGLETMRMQGNQTRALGPLRRYSPTTVYRLGLSRFRRALPVGQYKYPKGLFYGGGEQQQSMRFLDDWLPHALGGAEKILHLDFHTGLGAMGDYRLLLDEAEGSARFDWIASHFGRAHIVPWGAEDATAYTSHGLMGTYLKERFKDSLYCWAAAEFGTYGPLRVLAALRAEQRAYFYAESNSAASIHARREMMEVFCPASREWRERALNKA